jgi:small subunit ribosomal protein S3Ae
MSTQKGMDKWKGKRWFTVYAPAVFDKKAVGEIPANDEKSVIGRSVKVTLSNLTGNPEHSYTNVILKVTEANGNAASTKLDRIELPYSYTKSIAKKFRGVFDAIVPVKTSDGTRLVVKIVAVTTRKAAHAKIIAMRKQLMDFTEKYFAAGTLDDGVKAVVGKRYQQGAAAELDSIAQLSNFEVKKLEIH